MVWVHCACAVHRCSCAVLGAASIGFATTPAHLTLAGTSTAAVLLFFADQARRLRIFFRDKAKACWVPTERPTSRSEIDDPAFALLTRLSCGLIRPQARELGSYEVPEEE